MACFTRPEAKVERLSYPLITPSAARGIFDTIFWQPDLYWQLESVEVLALPRTFVLSRSEVKQRGPHHDTVLKWADGSEPIEPIMADGYDGWWGNDKKGKTQRQTVVLKDVAYRLHAHMVSRAGRCLKGADAQFRRRVQRGQCLHQPYFGQKEMVCYFRHPQPDDPAPVELDLDLGLMLYDVFPLSDPGWTLGSGEDSFTGAPSASFFRAVLRRGVMKIPPFDSPKVLKAEMN